VTFEDDKGKMLGTDVIKVNDHFTLNDVTLVDKLRYNPLSVSQLVGADLDVLFSQILLVSRRLVAEDRGCSSTGQVLGGRTIGRSGDTMCGLHRVKERVFLSLASKPRLTGFLIWTSKPATPGW
jgi:hypothetical protein